MSARLGEKDHLYLIDGSSYIFRAYHALPPLTRSDGTPVGAVRGFAAMLYKLLKDPIDGDRPTHLAVIFDYSSKTFRNEIYPEYKANRPPPPEDLIPQFSMVREAVNAFNQPMIEMDGYEADDIIATYARQAAEAGARVTIVSSDKDLMQLVNDKIEMYDTMKERRIGVDEVREKFGVGPERVVDVQALAGDSTDNVPGVPGIGVKTAAQLIEEYGDLETLLAHADEIKQKKRRENLLEFADQARLSKQLVTLKLDTPVSQKADELKIRDLDAERLIAYLDDMEFKTMRSRIAADLGAAVASGADAANDAAIDVSAYETITDEKQLRDWAHRVRETGFVAVDTETDSLNAMSARLVGVSLAVAPGAACYIPLGHNARELDFDRAESRVQIPMDAALKTLRPILEDPAILKIGQNIKYDALVLARHGVRLEPIDDTMLMSHVVAAGLHGHGMNELSQRYLDHAPIKFEEVVGKGKAARSFAEIDLATATKYAAEDADVTLRLHRVLSRKVAESRKRTVYETLERPLAPVLRDMEREGVLVDTDLLSRLSSEFAQRMGALEAEAHELAGESFNLGSPKQISEILFGKLGLPGGKKTAKGAWSTKADVLETLAAEGHELPRTILAWRQLSKLKSTYTDALPKSVNPETGRVHTSYLQTGAVTGRLASTDPNLQNIPIRTEDGRKIRNAFVAEKGNVLVSADYSQIELRLLAHIADLESLKQAFAEGLDIHAMTASELFGVPIEGMDPMVRRRAKAINFGIIYGISAFGLANQLGIPRSEAKSYIDAYFEKFPGIREYMDEQISIAQKHGYVETIFGRRCHTPNIKAKVPAQRAYAERQAINAPIQGAAADIIRRAMIRMPAALKKAKLNGRMLLQVHDELIFEAPREEADALCALAADVMANAPSAAARLDVPLVVDARAGANWGEAH